MLHFAPLSGSPTFPGHARCAATTDLRGEWREERVRGERREESGERREERGERRKEREGKDGGERRGRTASDRCYAAPPAP